MFVTLYLLILPFRTYEESSLKSLWGPIKVLCGR